MTRRLQSLAAGAVAALVLGGLGASPSFAAPKTARLLAPQLVATYDGGSADDAFSLFHFQNWLLRPDGSFGGFTGRWAAPHEDQPLELITLGGPVPAGQLRKQNVDGAPGGTVSAYFVHASGVEGYDWVFDDAEWRMARPGEQPQTPEGWVSSPPSLLAIDDRGRVARRVSLDFAPRTFLHALVPTGAGLRTIIRVADQGLDVRRSDGTLLAHVRQLSALRSAVGRTDGSVLLSGSRERKTPAAWSSSLVRVSPRGAIFRARDARGKFVLGDPLATVRGGVLLGPPSYPARSISLLTDRGKIFRRKLADLKLPWSDTCTEQETEHKLLWAAAGPSGLPIVGVECFVQGDRLGQRLQSFTVGLDGKLHARWAVAGDSRPLAGADGRLYVMREPAQVAWPDSLPGLGRALVAWREPGAPAPRRGRVLSVRRSGDGAVATIRCHAPAGSVCAGTARLTRGASGAMALPYALRGRPGKSAAVIRRHFDALPPGPGRLRVTLSR